METTLTLLSSITIVGFTLVMSLIVIFWAVQRRENQRSEQHLAQLSQLVALENNRNWAESKRFWERSDKRWADHEVLMRWIGERIDRDKR